ncbi:MAG: DUF3986 family protein [Bacillaceae bacterium]
MSLSYDKTCHWHIGYYSEQVDFEAIAYKYEDKDIWDVFFEFEEYGLVVPEKYKDCFFEHYGYMVFSFYGTREVKEEIGMAVFEKWLRENGILK